MPEYIGTRAERFTAALLDYISGGGTVRASVDATTGLVTFAISDAAIVAHLMASADELKPASNGHTPTK